MNFYYETPRLVLKTESNVVAPKVLDFYKKNRTYFDAFELTRPDNFYSEAFQHACLTYEYNEIIKNHALRFWLYERNAYYTNALLAPIIGSISISHIIKGGFQSGMFGYKLDHDYWGYGLAFESCSFVLNLAFEQLHLHRLESYIMPSNQRSIHLIERLGFQYEGLCKSMIEVNHVYEDHLQYACIHESHNLAIQ